jgi:hypothetical protein
MHWVQAFLLMLTIGALFVAAPIMGVMLGWIAGIGGGLVVIAVLIKMWKEENQKNT